MDSRWILRFFGLHAYMHMLFVVYDKLFWRFYRNMGLSPFQRYREHRNLERAGARDTDDCHYETDWWTDCSVITGIVHLLNV